jgi:prepilin-type N-terminal cleavage/methylation domain-containing protein
MRSSPTIARSRTSSLGGFTLLEIMIVVGIMGVILTMGVPIVYKAWKKAPMAKALSELQEVCSQARAQAIMQGRKVELIFYPREKRFAVGGSAAAPVPGAPGASAPMSLTGSVSAAGKAGQLPAEVDFEMLDINKLRHDFRLDETARVRFFPNGTCDELTVILLSDRGERRAVMLEVTTGLAQIESDLTRVH